MNKRNIIVMCSLSTSIFAVSPQKISNTQEAPSTLRAPAEEKIREQENNILRDRALLTRYLQQAAQDDFFRAAAQGDIRTLRARLQGDREVRGVNANLLDRNKRTALMYAAFYGSADIVKELLSIPGIQINRADDKGYTPLNMAVAKGHTNIADMLRDAGAKE